MASFIIIGGKPISGSINVSGAKNAALPILAASLLATEGVVLRDCPRLSDVENMLAILEALNINARWDGDLLFLDTSEANSYIMPNGFSKEIRSSIFMLGPLLSRFKHAVCTFPGGCEIGPRPIDLHFKGLSMLGVKIKEERGLIICDGEQMHSADIHLDYPSVGATENIMMAAARVSGETTIHNAAREPEIEDLQSFLVKLGYYVDGAGSSTIRIDGKEPCANGTIEHRIIPDRIVAGTLLCAAAITGGEIALNNVNPDHLGAVISKLREVGCAIYSGINCLRLSAPSRLGEISTIETLPYPGFPTDMQAQFFALCTIANGTCVIVENVFENRYKHGAELLRMGAYFTQKDRTIIIRGMPNLMGTQVTAWDLRGGAALTLAGLAAAGETVVTNAELIDRGYERLDDMLKSLGANIRRVD